MKKKIKALVLEDVLSDAELMIHELRKAGFEVEWYYVETEDDYLANLDESLDIILADYSLPQFDALRALRHLQERSLDIPLIVVTGSISEEVAVECMKQGAADYILKDRMARLGQSVVNALNEKKLRAEKRSAEEALRESEEKFRKLASSAQDAIVISDSNGKISFWSEGAERIFGYTSEEILGEHLHLLLLPKSRRNEYREAMEHFRKTGQGMLVGKTLELEAVKKDGSTFPIELSLSSVKIKGEWNGIGIVRDITERKRLEQQFQQAQKLEAIGRLAGGIAHDFNNLLTVITGYSQLLMNDLKEGDPMLKDIQEIKNAADRATLLTHQLLAFSRKQTLHMQVLDLNYIVRNMERMLQRLIGEDVEYHSVLEPEVLNIKADMGQIEQVIMNLVVNARDAMPTGGKLTIETRGVHLDETTVPPNLVEKPGAYVILTISDTGIGMDSETQSKIFEPFFTTKEVEKGTGLGLSTVYGIVKQSGGYIWVSSELGKGTTFKIYFPRVEEVVSEPEPSGMLGESLQGKETVLLVEDEAIVRDFTFSTLKRFGYEVLQARNAGEALLISEKQGRRIDLMITDVVMPKMGGRELVDRLKPLCPRMKVLYVSGYTDEAVVRQGLLEEEAAFLQKPFSPNELLKKVREVLEAG